MRVRNIQVLKGPQGTLFGRNATGGAVLINTKDPTPQPSAELTLNYANYDERMLTGVLSTGRMGDVTVGLVGYFRTSSVRFCNRTGSLE